MCFNYKNCLLQQKKYEVPVLCKYRLIVRSDISVPFGELELAAILYSGILLLLLT